MRLLEVIAARLVVLVYAIAVERLIPDHMASGVATMNNQVHFDWLRPFVKWDSVYFIGIASEGYKNEQQLPFLPLFPLLMNKLSQCFGFCFSVVSSADSVVIAGLLLNIACFAASFLILKAILVHMKLGSALIEASLLCFLCNPANVFFATTYSESLFASLSWLGVYFYLKDESSGCKSLKSCIPFFLASCVRSNGSVNAVFIASCCIVQCIKNTQRNRIHLRQIKTLLLIHSLIILSIGLPFLLINIHAYCLMCALTGVSVMGGTFTPDPSTLQRYCLSPSSSSSQVLMHVLLRSPYAYLQEKFWNVGLLRYYQLQQLPNFALAVPISTIAAWYLAQIGSLPKVLTLLTSRGVSPAAVAASHRDTVLLGLALHLTALLVLGLLFAHVQILTRLLCSSSPLVYVAMGSLLVQPEATRWRPYLVWYLLLFNLAGIALHVNHYPWT